MTTDVINGVPSETALRRAALFLNGLNSNCNEVKTLRALLATAQPADHSEHDLNMAAHPAADGEREAFIRSFNLDGKIYYDENTRQWLPCRDSVEGFQIAQRATEVWIGWQARAAQPQQTVAVTDEVRRLREVLTEIDRRNDNPARFDAEINRIVQAALAAHKTGEEE